MKTARVPFLPLLLPLLLLVSCTGAPALPELSAPPTPVPGGSPLSVDRGPYLQNVTAGGATIAWRSAAPGEAALEIRSAAAPEGSGVVPAVSEGRRHQVRLEDLLPATEYTYRLLDGNGLALAGEYAFRTPPTPGLGAPFSFAVLGDSGCACAAQRQVAAQIEVAAPDLLLHTGDVIYDRGEEENYDPQFFAPYKHILSSAPIYPVLGNHDMGTESGGPWLRNFFLPGDADHSTSYYSFDYANAHFIALDSEQPYSPTSRQYSWLLNDLEKSRSASPGGWLFVYMHRPPYSAGIGHGSDYRLRETLSPLFERFGADLVFSGHEHNYERSNPRRDYAAQGGRQAVVYVVSGGGGRTTYPVRPREWTAFAAAVHHFVRIEIDGNSLVLSAIDSAGQVIDRAEMRR